MKIDPFSIDTHETGYRRIPVTEITVAAGMSQNLGLTITEDGIYTNGGVLVGENISIGDWIEFQVVLPDGTVVKQWVYGWNLAATTAPQEIVTPYAGHPHNGMKLRIIYHREGTGDNPKVGINFYLHKEL